MAESTIFCPFSCYQKLKCKFHFPQIFLFTCFISVSSATLLLDETLYNLYSLPLNSYANSIILIYGGLQKLQGIGKGEDDLFSLSVINLSQFLSHDNERLRLLLFPRLAFHNWKFYCTLKGGRAYLHFTLKK